MLISGFSSLSFLKSEYPENRHTGYVIPSFPATRFNFRDGHFFSANDAQGHFIYACPPRQNPLAFSRFANRVNILSDLGADDFVVLVEHKDSRRADHLIQIAFFLVRLRMFPFGLRRRQKQSFMHNLRNC